jgi:hypothetical protein
MELEQGTVSDETIEQAKKTMLWCMGRAEELREEGVLTGGHLALTKPGRASYRELVLSGFRPGEDDVLNGLRTMRFPLDQIDAMCVLMMRKPRENVN